MVLEGNKYYVVELLLEDGVRTIAQYRENVHGAGFHDFLVLSSKYDRFWDTTNVKVISESFTLDELIMKKPLDDEKSEEPIDDENADVPLYRHPQPTLTDAEREAVELCVWLAEEEDKKLGFGKWSERAADLRGLLERTKLEKPYVPIHSGEDR